MIMKRSLIRPLVAKLQPYLPGEQPKIKGLIKLNTNENPYPPAPAVLAATREAVDERLRLYPNPTAEPLRQELARLHGCQPENIIVGNGSDEILALAVRCFVEPTLNTRYRRQSRSVVQFFTPSYSLYPVLAETHGAVANSMRLNPDFSLPPVGELKRSRAWDFAAALTLITTPNAPGGRGYTTAELDRLCAEHKGVVLLDEAYADFAGENALALALKHPHVLVARTFSKAYSICYQRVGYCVGHPEIIGALHKIRDSYNVNGLGQVAALATLDHLPYYRANFEKIIRTREEVTLGLTRRGFRVFPSQTNSILTRPPGPSAQVWQEKLRERKVLVRWFAQPEVSQYLRITVGTPAETTALLKAVAALETSL
jgi:histidinol-phosphate aminotransferase